LKLYNTIDQRLLQSIHAHIFSLTISYLCNVHTSTYVFASAIHFSKCMNLHILWKNTWKFYC